MNRFWEWLAPSDPEFRDVRHTEPLLKGETAPIRATLHASELTALLRALDHSTPPSIMVHDRRGNAHVINLERVAYVRCK
ncbi:hypothetical protein F8S09_15355 [Deinococcus sp. SDU3-2]|uniref:Uncharacterized protein n=1 Tax=Deinococcus terrestris TaxID=2651870 RepID=A0A7X1NYC1_9DEIO|nr:hypothetical protein [Deinococcus terrestris]MPY68033.1 hypothetical protein [Deinococcus terrestris]